MTKKATAKPKARSSKITDLKVKSDTYLKDAANVKGGMLPRDGLRRSQTTLNPTGTDGCCGG
jgi:hypothetical protein